MKRLAAGLLIAAVLGLTAAYYLAPWRTAVATRLEALLDARGLRNADFTIDAIGWRSATIKNIAIGTGDDALRLDSAVIGYTPDSLRRRRLTTVTATGLHIAAHADKAGFHVAGLPGKPAGSSAAPALLPASDAALLGLPFNALALAGGDVRLNGDGWQVELPLAGALTVPPRAAIRADSALPQFSIAGVKGQADAISATAVLQDGAGWTGHWAIKKLAIPAAQDLPQVDGAGTMAMTGDKVSARGRLFNPDKSWSLAFVIDEAPNDPAHSAITVVSAQAPWLQGVISTAGIVFPFAGTQPVRATVRVSRISVDGLLKLLTGKRIDATGSLSGSVPLTISRDGALLAVDGDLRTPEPGVIQLPPDAIPGDNAQIALLRTVLGNFHYRLLSITLKKAPDGPLTALLGIEGNNPDVYGGRSVKLNVHIGGDVLALAKQNFALLGNPQALLDQAKQ